MKRLLKPGGMIAAREPDLSTGFIETGWRIGFTIVQVMYGAMCRSRERWGGWGGSRPTEDC